MAGGFWGQLLAQHLAPRGIQHRQHSASERPSPDDAAHAARCRVGGEGEEGFGVCHCVDRHVLSGEVGGERGVLLYDEVPGIVAVAVVPMVEYVGGNGPGRQRHRVAIPI